MLNLSKEQIEAYARSGIQIASEHIRLGGELTFEPPITLHACVVIGPVSIGRYSYVGDFTHVAQNTAIGRYCSIGNSCTLGAQPHPLDWLSTHPFQYLGVPGAGIAQKPWQWTPTRIGHDVWIGSNVAVLAGVTIGDGAAIGAGAVVTRDVPPYAVAVGNPAKVAKSRFDKATTSELLELKWWDLPLAEIRELPFDDLPQCLARLREIRRRLPAAAEK
jgi:acetyltransferase-like isoleucine patch superfamily enzyme